MPDNHDKDQEYEKEDPDNIEHGFHNRVRLRRKPERESADDEERAERKDPRRDELPRDQPLGWAERPSADGSLDDLIRNLQQGTLAGPTGMRGDSGLAEIDDGRCRL